MFHLSPASVICLKYSQQEAITFDAKTALDGARTSRNGVPTCAATPRCLSWTAVRRPDYSYILAAVRIYESVEPYVAALRIVYGGWLTNERQRPLDAQRTRSRAAGPIATAAPRPARAGGAGPRCGRARDVSLELDVPTYHGTGPRAGKFYAGRTRVYYSYTYVVVRVRPSTVCVSATVFVYALADRAAL